MEVLRIHWPYHVPMSIVQHSFSVPFNLGHHPHSAASQQRRHGVIGVAESITLLPQETKQLDRFMPF
jgi:hypothetical protein